MLLNSKVSGVQPSKVLPEIVYKSPDYLSVLCQEHISVLICIFFSISFEKQAEPFEPL